MEVQEHEFKKNIALQRMAASSSRGGSLAQTDGASGHNRPPVARSG